MIRIPRFVRIAAISLILYLYCGSLSADTLWLKSGERIEGKICQESDSDIAIISDTAMGIMRVNFLRKDIERIEKNEGDEEIIEACAKSIFYFQEANARYNERDYERAINYYKQAIELNPKWAEVYYNLGLAYSKLGNFKEAHKNFNYALELSGKLRGDTPENRKFINKLKLQLNNIAQ